MRVVPVFQSLLVVMPLAGSLASFGGPALAADKAQPSAFKTQPPSERAEPRCDAGDKEDRTNLGRG